MRSAVRAPFNRPCPAHPERWPPVARISGRPCAFVGLTVCEGDARHILWMVLGNHALCGQTGRTAVPCSGRSAEFRPASATSWQTRATRLAGRRVASLWW